jgi:hypothetical protein
LFELAGAWFQFLSVGRQEHSEEALPPNFTSPPHLGSKKGEATRATEGKQCHITMAAVLILEWLCHAALGCGVQCAAQQWEQRLFLGNELKASQSQSRGARRRATGSRLISVASGVHVIKHALPVESWPPTRSEGCSRASPAAFFAKTINNLRSGSRNFTNQSTGKIVDKVEENK